MNFHLLYYPLKRIFFFLWIIHDFLRFLCMISWKNSSFYLSHFFFLVLQEIPDHWPIVLNLLMIKRLNQSFWRNTNLRYVQNMIHNVTFVIFSYVQWRKLIQSISTLGVLGRLFFYETGLKDVVWLFGRHHKSKVSFEPPVRTRPFQLL